MPRRQVQCSLLADITAAAAECVVDTFAKTGAPLRGMGPALESHRKRHCYFIFPLAISGRTQCDLCT